MINKGKRAICFIFLVLVIKDICDVVKYLIVNNGVKLERFLFYKTEFSDGKMIYNISIVYFVGITIAYFFLNFFKKEEEKYY